MSGDFGLVYPLWRRPADGPELLDRALGEVGLDHLTLPLVTGPLHDARIHTGVSSAEMIHDGGWHFAPSAKAYRNPPKPHGRTSGLRTLLPDLAELAANRSLAIDVRLDLRAAPELLTQFAHVRRRNAWGDEPTTGGACVCHPEFRELLRETLTDLESIAPRCVQLASWSPDLPAPAGQARPLDWLPQARELLDVCFCPACRQIATLAGIEPDEAARSARVLAERFAKSKASDPGPMVEPLLASYCHVRQQDAARWLERLSDVSSHRRHVLVYTPAETAQALRPAGWELMIRFLPTCPLDCDDVLGRLRDSGAQAVSFPAWRPAFEDSAALVRTVSGAHVQGVQTFDFEGLEVAAEESTAWLRQAVRFARRT